MGYLETKKAKEENIDLKKIAEDALENQPIKPKRSALFVIDDPTTDEEKLEAIAELQERNTLLENLSKDQDQEIKRLRISNTRLQHNLTNLKRKQQK